MKKVVIQFVTFAGVKPVHQEAQSSAIFGLSWKDSTCNSCSSTGESLYTMTQSNRKGCGFLHTSSKNRVDPEAVTEEDSESPLHCAWQGDHISTMAVLAEVVDAHLSTRKVPLGFTFLNPSSGLAGLGRWWRKSWRGSGRGR